MLFAAVKVSLVVGTALNVINQGRSVMDGHDVDWVRAALNYAVPFCVSSYSAARATKASAGGHTQR